MYAFQSYIFKTLSPGLRPLPDFTVIVLKTDKLIYHIIQCLIYLQEANCEDPDQTSPYIWSRPIRIYAISAALHTCWIAVYKYVNAYKIFMATHLRSINVHRRTAPVSLSLLMSLPLKVFS